MERSPKWQRNYTGPFRVVDVLSAVYVTIQKSKKAAKFVVHIDKLQSYFGDVPAAWVVGELLHAVDESLSESQTLPDFMQASSPAVPNDTDVGSEHGIRNIPSSVGNPPVHVSGRE